jgi:hypothetical protein
MMRKILRFVVGIISCIGLASVAQAITITVAEVQNGRAVVSGNKACKSSTITWDALVVTQSSKGGAFSFSGTVPTDCVGTLSDGVSTVEVVVLDCNAARFVDNLNGTITDTQTGLMWRISLAFNASWTSQDFVPLIPDGTTFTSYLAALNDLRATTEQQRRDAMQVTAIGGAHDCRVEDDPT